MKEMAAEKAAEATVEEAAEEAGRRSRRSRRNARQGQAACEETEETESTAVAACTKYKTTWQGQGREGVIYVLSKHFCRTLYPLPLFPLPALFNGCICSPFWH